MSAKEIILKSNDYEIIKLNRKTKAKGFCNLQTGDIIHFETKIEKAGRNGNRLYATGFICVNSSTNEKIGGFTHNESERYLDIFELKELSERFKNEKVDD